MPFVFLVLKKFSPYIILGALLFLSGSYVGYRFEYGVAENVKLALATQREKDAVEAEQANALAARYLVQANDDNNAVEGSLAVADANAGSAEDAILAQINTQAGLRDQDALDAPVLRAALDNLARDNLARGKP